MIISPPQKDLSSLLCPVHSNKVVHFLFVQLTNSLWLSLTSKVWCEAVEFPLLETLLAGNILADELSIKVCGVEALTKQSCKFPVLIRRCAELCTLATGAWSRSCMSRSLRRRLNLTRIYVYSSAIHTALLMKWAAWKLVALFATTRIRNQSVVDLVHHMMCFCLRSGRGPLLHTCTSLPIFTSSGRQKKHAHICFEMVVRSPYIPSICTK